VQEKCEQLWRKFNGELEKDNCFLPIESLAEADFDIYIIKQKEGELIFVPPDSPHQVINKVRITSSS